MARTAIASLLTLVSILAAPALAADPQITVIPPMEGAKVVDAALTPGKTPDTSTIHLLFNKDGAPMYAASTDNGKTFSPPIPVIKTKPAVPGLVFSGEQLAVSDTGKVFAVMSNNAWKVNLPKDQWGFYLATLEPGAKEFSPTQTINNMPSEGFSLAVNGKNVLAAFLAEKLFWKNSFDGGKTFTANLQIDPAYLPCPCCTTSLAFGKDGATALLYRESTNDNRDMFVILSKDGKHTRSPISKTLWKINACPMTYFKIVPLTSGEGYVAAWPTRGEAYFTRIGNDGKVWAPGEIKVGGKTGMRSAVFPLSGANDTTLIAWKDAETLRYQLFDNAGKPLGDPQQAKGAGPLAGGVVTPTGNYILFP